MIYDAPDKDGSRSDAAQPRPPHSRAKYALSSRPAPGGHARTAGATIRWPPSGYSDGLTRCQTRGAMRRRPDQHEATLCRATRGGLIAPTLSCEHALFYGDV